ncbi:MAG: zinc ribbon domain-containing protein [bacterium]|nr:MAG: zinc ribbon domain-containing protein [bacterium]
MSYAIFELKCAGCGLEYAQLLSEEEGELPIPCPTCDTDLEKGRKISGEELLSCGFSSGGG